MQPFKVKAAYGYTSPHDDELDFEAGQIITVTEEEDADWYYGEYKEEDGSKKHGMFPRNHVEIYEPITPPRPVRQAKKETGGSAVPSIPPAAPQDPIPEPKVAEESDEDEEPVEASEQPAPVPAKHDSVPEPEPSQSVKSPKISSPPTLPTATKPGPPKEPAKEAPKESSREPAPVANKPSGNSFRDRIAAFNKPAAPPIAPKPSGIGGGGSSAGFIKKQYVAPPPSRNAYVPTAREPPPQKVFRREEEPPSQVPTESEPPRPVISPPVEEAEDQPKPTSLKERIALLQKQQLEQQSRHAEAAQKKEKPKRPPKKRTESHQEAAEAEVPAEHGPESSRAPPIETEDDEEADPQSRPQRRRTKSRESVPLAIPAGAPRELLSDTNDADQSAGADTEDGADIARTTARAPPPPPRAAQAQPQSPPAQAPSDPRLDNEGAETSEEDEIDAETRRRMEIRDRMAKMSGGMGMAGMFGPPGGLPMGQKKTKASGDSGKKRAESNDSESTQQASAPPVPIMSGMALPGMHSVRSPEPVENSPQVTKEPETSAYAADEDSDPESVPDIEEVEKHAPSARRADEERPLPPVPQGRPVPPPPEAPRAAPPVPTERPAPPPPPIESRAVPPTPPAQLMSPDSGSESDDELPESRDLSVDTEAAASRTPAPPSHTQAPRTPSNKRLSAEIVSPVSSEAPSPAIKRNSRVPPPIPGGVPMPGMPSSRAPPPPPPQVPPPARRSTERDDRASDSEEVTEYEGDYDTDIASGAPHKDALKAHERTSSTDEALTGDESSYHHGGLPSLGPPSGGPPPPGTTAPRGVPPPPPSQPPKPARQSSDMPRGAPPPPPPVPKTNDEEYDPYNYSSPQFSAQSPGNDTVVTPRAEEPNNFDDDDLYSRSPPREPKRPAPPQAPPQIPPVIPPQVPPAALSQPYQSPPEITSPVIRQSLDVHRGNSTRRSMDAQRPSMEGGFIADDVDLGRGAQWWLQRKMPPPVFQNRQDVLCEVEETSVQKDGQELVMKQVYALFMDYSQTIISARFDVRDPSHADLQQRHEVPPPKLRQDQLEDAHNKFGVRIAQLAEGKVNSVVGNGSPFALVFELLSSFADALPPVGSRAYGALVYVNLANATVQQHDEIRAGDIVSFRNAKLSGHRGGLKQKYSMELGKPDHVGVVLDWDGTKKKIRAYEQGRESKKVKLESFKLGDLKNGEVKVWRIVARNWVGWGGAR